MDRWKSIAQAICDQIRSGGIPVGAAIPSTGKLMTAHGVARGTVRKAVDHLMAAGILRGEPGRGVYVVAVPPPSPPVPMDPMDELRQRVDRLERRMDRLEDVDH